MRVTLACTPAKAEVRALLLLARRALRFAFCFYPETYLMALARFWITPEMFVPRVPNTSTTANAIKAAATAYSESSNPVSSLRKPFIISSSFIVGFTSHLEWRGPLRLAFYRPGLLDVAGQVGDDAGDVLAKGSKHKNDCQGDQSRGHCVFGKFQTGFVSKKFGNHFKLLLMWLLVLFPAELVEGRSSGRRTDEESKTLESR